jgi:hypothetical protein
MDKPTASNSPTAADMEKARALVAAVLGGPRADAGQSVVAQALADARAEEREASCTTATHLTHEPDARGQRCAVRLAIEQIAACADARAEFDKLRSLVAQSKMACIYCGVGAGGPCPAGYPGCGRMDDLMNDADFVARLDAGAKAHLRDPNALVEQPADALEELLRRAELRGGR